METLTTIFSLPLTEYGLMAALALLLALGSAGLWAMRQGADARRVLVIGCVGVVLTWFMSRVVFVCCSYKLYLGDVPLIKALDFWDGGYSMIGAFAGLVLTMLVGAKLTGVRAATLLDGLALGLPVALVCARIAEAGTGLDVGWYLEEGWPSVGLLVEAEYGTAHAIYKYAAIAAILIGLAVALQARRKDRREGSMMLTFMLLFGAVQVFLESLRDDGHMEIHMGVHMQQVFSAVMLVLAIILWAVQAYRMGTLKKVPFIGALVVTVGLVVLAVVAEFGVDRWDSKVLAYGIMVGCLFLMAVIGLVCRRLTYGRKA